MKFKMAQWGNDPFALVLTADTIIVFWRGSS